MNLWESLASEFQQYEGRHNFHNFSKGIGSDKPEAFRKIHSAKVDLVQFTPLGANNLTELTREEVTGGQPRELHSLYFRLRLTGNSFMYHQIRKMIGLILMRRLAPQQYPDPISSYLQENKRLIITAPSEGLLLDKLHLGSDDPATRERMKQKEGPQAEDVSLTAAEEQERLLFKHQVLYPQIHTMETENQVFGDWLHWAESNTSKLEEFGASFRDKWGPNAK